MVYSIFSFQFHYLNLTYYVLFQINAILTVDSYKDAPLGIQHSDPSFRCTEAGDNKITLQLYKL